MHIVFLMPIYYPDSAGGAERHTRILARAMRRKGVAATILAPTRQRRAGGTAIEDDVTVVRIPVRHEVFLGGRYVISMLAWWVRAFAWLARHRATYDVIAIQHVRLHAAPGLLAGILFAKTLSGKLGRGGAHFELRRLPRQRLPFGRLVVAMARRSRLVFVANSTEIEQDLREFGIPDARIARVPNGVECPPEPLSAYRDPEGRQVFVYAGRLSSQKRVGELIEAFRTFAGSGRRCVLKVYGSGPLEEELRDTVEHSSLRRSVLIGGLTDSRDLIFGGAAFMVLPSDSEGMSNALLEAMAYGVVPVITEVSGAGDLVADGRTGLLLAGNDPGSILRGLERAGDLDARSWREMSAAARRRITEGFAIDAVAQSYLDLYAGARGAAGDRSAPEPGRRRWRPGEAPT